MSWGRRPAVIHLDMDAFYASVEQRRRPELRSRPVIVGGASLAGPVRAAELARDAVRRGVVSAASYEARRFGVHSAMPLITAIRCCPDALVVGVDFPAYRAASAEVFAIVARYTPTIEPIALDEAYLDVAGSVARFGEPPAIAAEMLAEIGATTELSASAGVATTRTAAKIASDLRKPGGLVVVKPGEEAAFLAPMPLRRLPGLGPATERTLAGLGVSTLGQLAALPEDVLRRRLGVAHGADLWRRANGQDPTPVAVPGRPRSVSREETFGDDVADRGVLEARIRELAADVGRRLRAAGHRGRTVTLKLRTHDFATVTRQRSLADPVDADQPIAAAAATLLAETWRGAPVRLLGVGVEVDQGEAAQLELLGSQAGVTSPGEASQLDGVLDTLRRRFGDGAVRRGAPASLRDHDVRGDDLRRLADAGRSQACPDDSAAPTPQQAPDRR